MDFKKVIVGTQCRFFTNLRRVQGVLKYRPTERARQGAEFSK